MGEESLYHAVPYDYRIAQILVEGMLGIRPEVPIDIVRNWSNEHGGLPLERNANKFRKWWDTYGGTSGEPMTVHLSASCKVLQIMRGRI